MHWKMADPMTPSLIDIGDPIREIEIIPATQPVPTPAPAEIPA